MKGYFRGVPMENRNWSEKIQSIYSLDTSRDLRFTENKIEEIIEFIRIKNAKNILEVGCGTGTFTRKIRKYLSKDIKITGLDMDHNFINYCRKKAKKEKLSNIQYIEGDALSLPFDNNTFDACTSHTVIEHVPNKKFLEEQYRVCKEGGYVSILNIRPELALMSKDNITPTTREKVLMNKIGLYTKEVKDELKVGKYFDNPQNILRLFEKVGFKEIHLDTLNYVSCTDDARNSYKRKRLIIESEHESILQFINMSIGAKESILTVKEKDELMGLINERYVKRINMLDENKRLWDFNISPMIIISGQK